MIFSDIVTLSCPKWLLRFERKWKLQIWDWMVRNFEKFTKSNFSEIKFAIKKVQWPCTFGLAVLKLEGLLLSYLLWSIEFAMVFVFFPSQAEVMDAGRSINFKQLNFCIFLSKLAWVVMGIVWVVNDRHTRNFQLIFVFKSAVAPCVYIIYCLCLDLTSGLRTS